MSEWIKHTTEKMPVPEDTQVSVVLRDGAILMGHMAGNLRWHSATGTLSKNADIVEYCVLGEIPLPTPVIDVTKDTNPKQSVGLSKLPLHLASPLAIAYMSVGLANGAGKYGISNYKGTEVIMSIYLSAIMRHFMAIMEGEEFDQFDGTPHFGAIMANVAIILDARATGKLIDDRPIQGGYLKELEALTKIYQNLVELHKDKTPFHYTRNNVGD